MLTLAVADQEVRRCSIRARTPTTKQQLGEPAYIYLRPGKSRRRTCVTALRSGLCQAVATSPDRDDEGHVLTRRPEFRAYPTDVDVHQMIAVHVMVTPHALCLRLPSEYGGRLAGEDRQ